MKKLRYLILAFCGAVSLPLGFVVWQTYSGLQQEERAQMRYFAETLFDQMEYELAELVQKEENRSVDEYGHFIAGTETGASQKRSPLALKNYPSFILGYIQNNPDGSFQTPLIGDMGNVPEGHRESVLELKEVNDLFNKRKVRAVRRVKRPGQEEKAAAGKDAIVAKTALAERYLKSRSKTGSPSYLGKKKQRVEEITRQQAYTIAQEEDALLQAKPAEEPVPESPAMIDDRERRGDEAGSRSTFSSMAGVSDLPEQPSLNAESESVPQAAERFQVEVAPFQSLAIDSEKVFVFRRIGINSQIYRQGFVVLAGELMEHLVKAHFSSQPLAGFSHLQMIRNDLTSSQVPYQAGVSLTSPIIEVTRSFPPPFDFLQVSLAADSVPASPARGSLNIAVVLLGLFLLLGLLAIYQSVRSIVALSERRSQFVSSVTHELKTPLTTIRMYVEMLEQGIAATPEKEQEYLGILGSESSRLSGLINNVLELSKLEKKTRQFNLQPGKLDDVFSDVKTIMAAKLDQEGFGLTICKDEIPEFRYDRDVLLQILLNLLENSIKFGKKSPNKKIAISADILDTQVRIRVADSGPGIPKRALKRVFDDFYRVDNSLSRMTGGTGIGLALVKKFVTALGGSVTAENNEEAGCTITLLLPLTCPNMGHL